ncbi:hypothetical protein CYCD_13110 [Tenuifilaceae bacterium CYCD]|nr:hypothetical protein CYCD_13110 [Tenuifilaceae bacterium CYCD]
MFRLFKYVLPLLSLFLCVSFEYGFTQSVNHWETAVFSEDQWRYRVNESELPSNWYGVGFDDSSWLLGNGGFGYEDNDDNTTVPACMSVSIRQTFTITNKSDISAALLHVDYDDAFVAWINGVEVARSAGLIGQSILWDSPSSQSHEAVMFSGGTPQSFYLSADQLNAILVQGQNVIAVQVHNTSTSSSDLSLRPYLSFGILSTSQYFAQPPSWFVAPNQSLDSNLPLVILDTHGQTISRDADIVASMKVVDQDGKRNSITDTEFTYSGSVHIEYHGQSSFYNDWPKKNYNVELIDAQEENIDAPLLGMPAGNDWVLYGPYNDKSLIRNAFTYALGRRLGHYAPRTAFCEVVLNGEYVGLYILVEKIRRDKNRVDIAKLKETDIQGDDLTGGYIVKIDKGDWDEFGWSSPYTSTNGYSINFYWHYPKADKIQTAQKQYIQNYISTFENTLMGSSWNSTTNGYYRYVNMPSLVDYFIVNEFSKNVDAYRISTFLHKDKDSKGGKLTFGPIWDYDLSFGNANYYEGEKTDGWVFISIDPADSYPVPFWWGKFIQDDTFKSQLKCRWKTLRNGVLNSTSINSLVDSLSERISEARVRNFEKYPVFGIWVWPNYFVGTSYEEEIDYMKNFIAERLQWLDANLPGTCNPNDIDTTDYSKSSVKAYPNPFTDNLTLTINLSRTGKTRIDFVDITGCTIWTMLQEVDEKFVQLNLNNIDVKPGLYLVRVLVDDEFVGTARVVRR